MQRAILEELVQLGIDAIYEFVHLEKFQKDLNEICINKSQTEIFPTRMIQLRLENVKATNFLKAITGLTHRWRPDSTVALNADYLFELNHLIKVTPKK